MAKQRVVTGFGPGSYVLTQTATSAQAKTGGWLRLGPFLGSRFSARHVFSTNSTAASSITVQGVLNESSSPTTAGVVTLIPAKSSTASGTAFVSTSAAIVSWIRTYSSLLSTGRSVTTHFAAIA